MAVHEIARRLVGGVWRTVDAEEDGGGGSQTPPVTFTGTDPDESVLTLNADDAQTAHIFRVYDENGDLAADIDKGGVLDARQITVQDSPDTGGGAGEPTGTLTPGRLVLRDDGTNPVLEIHDAAPLDRQVLLVKGGGHGDILEVSPSLDTDVSIQIILSAATSVNVLEVWDHAFNVMHFAISKGGGVIFPSVDPEVAGAWWDNAGTLTRSAG